MQLEFWKNTGRPFRVGGTCEPSRLHLAIRAQTLSRAAFPAKTRAQEIRQGKGLMGPGRDSGDVSRKPFAHFDHASQSWKTSQGYLFEDLGESSVTLPSSGTMRNGKLYRQPPLVPHTAAIGYSWLPTPAATDYKGCSRDRFRGSPALRRSRTAEVLRLCEADPIYPNPCFIEMAMGFPIGHTDLNASATP